MENRLTHSLNFLYRKDKQEIGGTMAFMAIFLFVLIMFTAIVIDLSLLAGSKDRAQSFAQIATLSAVEQYFASDSNLTEMEKRNAAVARVNEVIATNNITTPRMFGTEEGKPPEVKLSSATNIKNTDATLEPGRWYFVETDTGSECGGKPPCFVAATTDTESVNAFRLNGNFYTYVTSSFGKIVTGSNTIPITVSTVATVIPRHGIFMVDLSSSTIRETHLLEDDATKIGVTASEFGFTLSSDNPNIHNSNVTSQTTDNIWTALDDTRPNTNIPDANYNKIHYKSDYIKKKLLSDTEYTKSEDYKKHHPSPYVGEYSTGTKNIWARVDVFRDGYYKGPQPLTTIFAGLKYAIESFDKRKVGGDQIGLMFYDEQLEWPRIVEPTADFRYLKSMVDFTDADLSTLHSDLSNIQRSDLMDDVGLEKIIRHNLFPSGTAFTDMPKALSQASNMLRDARADQLVDSSDFIVFIGDGLTNCIQTRTHGQVCADTYTRYAKSMSNLQAITLSENFVNANIPIHVIMVGNEVGPHTAAVSLPNSTECLTDTEARLAGIPYVIGGTDSGTLLDSFDNRKDTPFYQASFDLYKIALATRGIWAPMRPVAASCPNKPSISCSPTPSRITEDPLCRNYAEQIQDYMDKIISSNPYVIVDVE